ncbi:glucose-1-phosphate nucleotidyltransferase [Clostridium acetobutylicum]|nr:glucose-1-phosphate nucleotidyltransferase [Clostridium acetobutylicum]
MKAIIMAGGQGKRLRPLTCNLPKPMMPIMQKPVLQYIIELLKKHGINEIGITLHYLPDEVMDYFGDGKELGVSIHYFIEQSPLGTAGSVRNAESFLDETFVVISGDALTDVNLTNILQYHKEKKAMVTIVLKKVTIPLEYGVAITDTAGRISNFIEKPGWGEIFSDKANTGIYVMEPGIFEFYNKDKKFDFSEQLFPELLKSGKEIFGYVVNDYWRDIGNIEQFMKCNFDILNGYLDVDIDASQHQKGVWIGKNTIVSDNVKVIPPVYIGDNSEIRSGAEIGPFAVIGRNNIISEMATIKRSIIFENCYIGSGAELRGSVVSNNVQVGGGVSTFEESAIGTGSLVGEKSVVKAGVKIWPDKVIGSKTIIKTNVVWGENRCKVLFGKEGISGEINVELTPEFVSKLASAFASNLRMNSKVVVCSDYNLAAEMLKYSFVSGLLSMGIEVYSAKEMTIPMLRFSTAYFKADAAVYIYCKGSNKEKVNILFIDKDGIMISRSMEKKIASSFLREDFRRTRANNFKRLRDFGECMGYYEDYIKENLCIQEIRNSGLKVAVSMENKLIKNVVKSIFSDLKIQYSIYDNYADLEGLKKEVIEKKMDFGVCISENCDKAIIIDENASIISTQMYESIKALILISVYKFKTIVAPVNSSKALKYIAKRYNCKYVKSKISERYILNEYILNEKDKNIKEVLFSYLSSTDALNIVINIINILARGKIKLSELMERIPNYILREKEIACSWDNKGKIMRSLIEENISKSIELIEGIKVNYEDAWVLIIPDSDEPICKIYAESNDEEKTDKIINEFESEIELFMKN